MNPRRKINIRKNYVIMISKNSAEFGYIMMYYDIT